MCWFLDAGKKEAPHAQLTGVQKAPRHEVAGSWVPAGQRALWGFNAGAKLDDRREGDRIRAACPDVGQFRRVHWAFGRAFEARRFAMGALMDAAGLSEMATGVEPAHRTR